MTRPGEAKRLYREHTPDAVVGFGGYPAFPALLAASALSIPTVIHEQNAVLGRVNRLLAGEAEAIATAYDQVDRLKPELRGQGRAGRQSGARRRSRGLASCRSRRSTNMRRSRSSSPAAARARACSARSCPKGSACSPVASPPAAGRPAMPGRGHRARSAPAMPSSAFPPSSRPTSRTCPTSSADAHLVIGRAGASTIAELTAAGRPAILIPLPIATDDHQTSNAREMVKAGGARTIAQATSRRTCSPGRSRRWRWTRSRSPTRRRGRCRSAVRMPRATSPTWSSGSANGAVAASLSGPC